MDQNLINLLSFFKNEFPKIQEKKLLKIIFTLKSREEKYWVIGFSRLESPKFWLSEASLRKIINFLIKNEILVFFWKRLRKEKDFYCNVYTIWWKFNKIFKEIKFFAKKIFNYFDPILILNYVSFKEKRKKYIISHKWANFIIQKTWKFKNKIYSCEDNCIIDPNLLLN